MNPSVITIESKVLSAARRLLNNPALQDSDILQWSGTEDIKPQDKDEVVVILPHPFVNVRVKKSSDKRLNAS